MIPRNTLDSSSCFLVTDINQCVTNVPLTGTGFREIRRQPQARLSLDRRIKAPETPFFPSKTSLQAAIRAGAGEGELWEEQCEWRWEEGGGHSTSPGDSPPPVPLNPQAEQPGLWEQAGEGDERLLEGIRCRGWADAAKEQRPGQAHLSGREPAGTFFLSPIVDVRVVPKGHSQFGPHRSASPCLYREGNGGVIFFHR